MKKKARIAVLVSGGGTNLQAILDAAGRGELSDGEVTLVISDRAGAYALERATMAGIPSVEINKKACGGQKAFEEKLLAALEENRTDLIVLARGSFAPADLRQQLQPRFSVWRCCCGPSQQGA